MHNICSNQPNSFHVPFFPSLSICDSTRMLFHLSSHSPFSGEYQATFVLILNWQKFLPVFVLLNISFLEIGTTMHFKQKGMVLISNYLLHVKIKISQQCIRVLYTGVYFISTVCENNFHNTFATIYSKIINFLFHKKPLLPMSTRLL